MKLQPGISTRNRVTTVIEGYNQHEKTLADNSCDWMLNNGMSGDNHHNKETGIRAIPTGIGIWITDQIRLQSLDLLQQ